VGFTGNKDFIPWLLPLVKQNPPESKIARFAAISLMALGDISNNFVESLKELLRTKDNQHMAIKYLLEINTPEALLAIADHLHNFEYADIDNAIEIATDLFRKNETKAKASQFVLDNYTGWMFCQSNGRYLEILPEIDCPNVRDILIEEAFTRNIRYSGRIIHAIKGLWKIDQPSALRASKLNLKRASAIKDFIPRMLVQLSEEFAIEILCDHMPNEETTSTCWSIGRALRNVKNRENLENCINKLLSSNNRLERAAAVEIIGWQEIGLFHQKLENLALNDIDETVSRKSIEALKQHEEQSWIKEFLKDFQSASRIHRWSLLDSIIALGDPYILSDKKDALWIGQILNDSLPEYVSYAENLIKKRKEDVLKKAQNIDFKKSN